MDKDFIREQIVDALYQAEGGWQNPADRRVKAEHSADFVLERIQRIGLVTFGNE